MNIPEFRLNEFREVAKWVGKKFPAPVAFFLIGWLWGLEDIWIDAKTKAAVEQAIAPHVPDKPTIDGPTYTAEPSEVEGLDTIGFSYEFSEKQEP